MSTSLRLRLEVSPITHPELYRALQGILPRARGDRLRTLATVGLVASSSGVSLALPPPSPAQDNPDAHAATRTSLLDKVASDL